MVGPPDELVPPPPQPVKDKPTRRSAADVNFALRCKKCTPDRSHSMLNPERWLVRRAGTPAKSTRQRKYLCCCYSCGNCTVVLERAVNNQVIVRTYVNFPIDHERGRELYRASQGVPRGIFRRVVKLSGEMVAVIGVQHACAFVYSPQHTTAIAVCRYHRVRAGECIRPCRLVRRRSVELAGDGAQVESPDVIIGSAKIHIAVPIRRRAEVALQVAGC